MPVLATNGVLLVVMCKFGGSLHRDRCGRHRAAGGKQVHERFHTCGEAEATCQMRIAVRDFMGETWARMKA